jgi:hypothetical protein
MLYLLASRWKVRSTTLQKPWRAYLPKVGHTIDILLPMTGKQATSRRKIPIDRRYVHLQGTMKGFDRLYSAWVVALPCLSLDILLSSPLISRKKTSTIRPLARLRNITIHVLPLLIPLHIILLDQPINIPLDIRHRQHSSTHRGLDNLTHQFRMPNRLATLHDPHNRRLGLEIPVFGNTHVSFFVFFFGFFELDLVDFDAVFGVREVGVEGEGVGGRDFFAFGVFGEGAQFCAREGLKGALYFGLGWWGC